MSDYNPNEPVSTYGHALSQQVALLKLSMETLEGEVDRKCDIMQAEIDEKLKIMRDETDKRIEIFQNSMKADYVSKTSFYRVLKILVPLAAVLIGFLFNVGIKIEERSHEISTQLTEIQTRLDHDTDSYRH